MDSSTLEKLQTWLRDAHSYTEENIVRLPSRNTIRLLVIIGVYCLLRPLLLKGAGLKQGQDYEKLLKEGREGSAATEAPSASDDTIDLSKTGNSDTDDDEERKTRRRHQPLQGILEGKDMPATGAEAGSDKEIEEFLRRVIK